MFLPHGELTTDADAVCVVDDFDVALDFSEREWDIESLAIVLRVDDGLTIRDELIDSILLVIADGLCDGDLVGDELHLGVLHVARIRDSVCVHE